MGHLYDLTLPLATGMPTWPGDPAVNLKPHLTLAEHGVRVSKLLLGTHSGTHLDAPAHLLPDCSRMENIGLDLLCGAAVVLDVSQADQIDAQTLDANGLPAGCERLLLRTRNSVLARLHQPIFDPDYVALTADGARWLVERGVRLVGIDALSVDPFASEELPAHRALLSQGVVIVEGLDLRHVPAGAYTLICAPLLLIDADGAPARVFLRKLER